MLLKHLFFSATSCLISSIAKVLNFLRSMLSGCSLRCSRIVETYAMRKSVSELILQTLCSLQAFASKLSSTPLAPFTFPPNLFIFSTYFCGTEDAPWRTRGKFGKRFSISLKISNLRFASSLNLYAP